MLKKKKILLAAGCSYTDANFKSRDNTIPEDKKGGWPMWPELVAKEFNLEVINYGKRGKGNGYILEQILNGLSIYKDRVDTVAVLLTAAERYNFFNMALDPSVDLDVYLDLKTNVDDRGQWILDWFDTIGGTININYWKSEGFSTDTYKYIVDHYFFNILSLIKMCEAYKVKLVIMQGIRPIHYAVYDRLYKAGEITHPGPDPKTVGKWALDSFLFQEIENNYSDKIIGWPILDIIGGFWYDLNRNNSAIISEKDFHPNASGQMDIASYYIKKMKQDNV
jgi:hypothetical protein